MTRFVLTQGDKLLLCTDGLTKHVPDERIAATIANMTSSEQVARSLVDDTLKAGASDNVTVLMLQTVSHKR